VTLLQIHEPGQTPAPHAEERGLAVGIDLGTTNSVVAVAVGEKPEALRDEAGRSLLPSVVAYGADGTVTVGEEARRQLLDAPEGVVGSIKRLMGRAAGELAQLGGTLLYDVDQTAGGGMVRLKIRGRSLTPVEISAEILRAVKARAEAALGQAVTRAVVTVPAYFDDAARSATKDAAKLAGLDVLRLVNEPTAAALAYGLDRAAEGIYAVYDLGGGTFDISLLRLEKGVFQVLATGGDAALGGDDFDHLVADRFLAERRAAGIHEQITSAEAKIVLAAARLAKECLTEQEAGAWQIEAGGKATRHRLTRAELEAMLRPLVRRTIDLVQGVLEDAKVSPAEVKGVVLVGGSTRMPLVRREVAALFGREPLGDIDPDEVVALGAALQAQALTRGEGALLLDVTPLSLGIETMGGIVEKVIPRNTPIPVAMAQDFTTYQDGQTGMMIHVVQGERETVDECRSLGRFELRGIPPMTAGAARIRVTFSVDADGLLTVGAEEKTTGVKAHIEVKPSYGLGEEEMARMLRESLENAQEDMERRLLIEARVEAERVLMALDAALEADGALAPPAERREMEAVAARLKAAVAGTDRDLINGLVEELERAGKPFAQRRIDRAIQHALGGHRLDEIEADMAGDRVPPP
jgi:molecular chaperone HscA